MRPFTQVDVFTDELTLGNALAVVHDAEGIPDDTMAAVARWTRLAETTFLLPPTDPSADYRVRIFTPERELPFAGHPTVGSAWAWLAAGGVPCSGGDELVQECGAGLVRLRGAKDGTHGGLAFAAPPLRRGGPVDAGDVATLVRALRIAPDDVVDTQWVDNGPGWVAVLLRDAAAVLEIEPDGAAFGALEAVGVVGPHTGGGAEADVEVRAFTCFDGGLNEDPVTGSLNAGLGQWLTASGRLPERYVAAQGTRLARRGRVHVERDGDDVWVGGDVVAGVRGAFGM